MISSDWAAAACGGAMANDLTRAGLGRPADLMYPTPEETSP